MGVEVTLQMVFTTASGGRMTLSVPRPLTDLTSAAIEGAMDEVLGADVFITAGGGLTGKVRATLVSRQTETIIEF